MHLYYNEEKESNLPSDWIKMGKFLGGKKKLNFVQRMGKIGIMKA